MSKKGLFAVISILVASLFPDLLLLFITGSTPSWLVFLKVILLAGLLVVFRLQKEWAGLIKLCGLLITIPVSYTH
ncbi:MAG: hypothetical protein N2376_15045, partial [Clostridia bacterium]|nr:hypothetical protein [Clostridia bacterium]